MTVTINGSNTPTAGGVTYGNGTEYATTSAGTSGQALISAGASAPTWGALGISGGGTNSTATPTAGGVGYGTGTAHAYTSAGTTGQVLTSAGASAPTWATPATGAMVLLSTINASGSATVDVETGFSSTYDNYVIYGNTIYGSVGSQQLRCVLKIGGTYQTGATYLYTLVTSAGGATTYSAVGGTNTAFGAMSNATISSSAARGFNFKMDVLGANDSSSFKYVKHYAADTNGNTDSTGTTWWTGGGGALSGVRIYLSSGNVTGTFYLFGIKNT